MGRTRNQARLNRKNKVHTPRKQLEARIAHLEDKLKSCRCEPITDEMFDEDLKALSELLDSLPPKAFKSYMFTEAWYNDMMDSPYAP